MRTTMCIVAVLAMLLILGSCKARPEEMKILTENYPPLSYMDNGEVTGYGTAVVQAMQQELKTNFPIQMMQWSEAYSIALSEANVILFTMDKTPEREQYFHFIGPLGSSVASLYAHKNNMVDLEDLNSAKAVGGIATTSKWYTEQHLIKSGFVNLISKADPLDTVRLLANQEADLGVFTDVTFPELCREAGVNISNFMPVWPLISSEYYIAVSKATSEETLKLWQDAFTAIQAKGTLDQLRTTWFQN
ncbi:MAG TPA: transporter substrate-binding domain-containing protein, partial [Candidatus Cloacimonadota bacterium]|nr:transporter substrate-binding domain-containing protein [Candidatus Cloacimonadota bacterium]